MTLSEDSIELHIIFVNKWLPLDNPFLKHCQFISFEDRNKRTFNDVIEIITLMKNLYDLVLENTIQLDLLENELLKYQSIRKKDIPNDIWKSAIVYKKNAVTYHRVDIICAHIWKPMPLLGKIASSILTIPHNNAAEERVFSKIKKNKNELRADLELS